MATTKQNYHPRKVIFSFTSYAKEVTASLKSSNVHVSTGLTTAEITAVETAACFTFPPDLRSILADGLPVGPGFPNWRSSSPHQLRLLTSLPILSLAKEVSRNNFWAPQWGPRPNSNEGAVALARKWLGGAPILVPVFRHCYVPCEPKMAGNPVFYVHGGEVRLLSADVEGFYKGTEFGRRDWVLRGARVVGDVRRVEFWSEVAESGNTRGRWWWGREVGGCLEEVVGRLREGGWGEEDVREMLMVDGGGDACLAGSRRVGGREEVARHVRSLSRELLRSGWSVDDVVYSLGHCNGGGGDRGSGGGVEVERNNGGVEGEGWVDFNCHSSQQDSLVLSR